MQTVLRELDSFLNYLRAQMPNSVDEVGKQLTAYYFGCTEVLRRAIAGEGVLASKRHSLLRLTIYQTVDIIAAFHSAEVVIKAASTTSNPRNYALVYFDGVASMYGRSQSYVEGWLDFLSKNPDASSEHFSVRLIGRQFDEIAPVLGEYPNNVVESMLWGQARIEVARFARAAYDSFGGTQDETSSSRTATAANETMPQAADGWPRLPVDLLAGLSAEEQLLIRQHEAETIAVSKMQLDDICSNCHVKPQFAKTFRVLRRDLRQMLDKLRSRMFEPRTGFSDGYMAALLRSTDAIISYKLDRMATHFSVRWGEPIENWAGKEGSAINKAGCSVLLLVGGSSLVATVCLLFA